MKYTQVVLAAFVSMAASIPTGEMDRTLGNLNDAASNKGSLAISDPMRSGRLPAGEESDLGNIMEIPIVTVDKPQIHQRDGQFKEEQKLPNLPMAQPNLREQNEQYEEKLKLPILSTEESKFHQRDEHYKGQDMRGEDSISSRLSTLREGA